MSLTEEFIFNIKRQEEMTLFYVKLMKFAEKIELLPV